MPLTEEQKKWVNDPFLTKKDFGPDDTTFDFLHGRGVMPDELYKPETRIRYKVWIAKHGSKP